MNPSSSLSNCLEVLWCKCVFAVKEHLLPCPDVLELIQKLLECCSPEVLQTLLEVHELTCAGWLFAEICYCALEGLHKSFVSFKVHCHNLVQQDLQTVSSLAAKSLIQLPTVYTNHLQADLSRKLLPYSQINCLEGGEPLNVILDCLARVLHELSDSLLLRDQKGVLIIQLHCLSSVGHVELHCALDEFLCLLNILLIVRCTP
mmetsp:Transcript_74730/g.132193  ORF Transcript_74730/g.132193 Transcript_74730/m.132193 type:complete len:203 (+) Transcript_74730:185-793(+)